LRLGTATNTTKKPLVIFVPFVVNRLQPQLP